MTSKRQWLMKPVTVSPLWKSRIIEEYEKICVVPVHGAGELRAAWQTNWEEKRRDCDDLWDGYMHWVRPVAGNETEESAPQQAEVIVYKGFRRVGVQSAPDVVLRCVERWPPTKIWTPLQQNVLAKDKTLLTNFPSFGEKSSDHNDEFNVKLLDAYDGQFHGQKAPPQMTNDRFVQLVRQIRQTYGDEIAQLYRDEHSDQSYTFPADFIFQAISAAYPAKGSPRELWQKYVELTEEDDPKRPKVYTPNIDGPNAVSAPLATIMNSYHTKFCRRCFIYNCLTHPPSKDPPGPNMNMRRFSGMEVPAEPCGAWCYMLLECGKENLAGNDNAKPAQQAQASTAAMWTREWSGADESLFRALHGVFRTQYCKIAVGMITKNCQQVYEFAQKDTEKLPPQQENAAPQPKSKQKNKNQRRTWTAASSKVLAERDKDTIMNDYTPCVHEGPCTGQCPCSSSQNFCEKYCECSADCPRRFPGCRCKSGCSTSHCVCFLANRECDIDVCKCDGASEKPVCKNTVVQKRWHKHLKMGRSDVSGWGMFAVEDIEKGEFIYEYCGEMISQAEAHRRGLIYDEVKVSYMFDQSNQTVLDATHMGNKLRFANHSTEPNCEVKTLMVNGDYRNAAFATRKILSHEEILFDYKYNDEDKKIFFATNQEPEKKH